MSNLPSLLPCEHCPVRSYCSLETKGPIFVPVKYIQWYGLCGDGTSHRASSPPCCRCDCPIIPSCLLPRLQGMSMSDCVDMIARSVLPGRGLLEGKLHQARSVQPAPSVHPPESASIYTTGCGQHPGSLPTSPHTLFDLQYAPYPPCCPQHPRAIPF